MEIATRILGDIEALSYLPAVSSTLLSSKLSGIFINYQFGKVSVILGDIEALSYLPSRQFSLVKFEAIWDTYQLSIWSSIRLHYSVYRITIRYP